MLNFGRIHQAIGSKGPSVEGGVGGRLSSPRRECIYKNVAEKGVSSYSKGVTHCFVSLHTLEGNSQQKPTNTVHGNAPAPGTIWVLSHLILRVVLSMD